MPTLTIESKRTDTFKNGRIFVDSNINDLIDDWFRENEIHKLDFKCKTWSSLKRKATSMILPELRKISGVEGAKYSHKAGCQCGCSPGYIVTGKEWNYKSSWVGIHFEDNELQSVKEFMNSEAKNILTKEINENVSQN